MLVRRLSLGVAILAGLGSLSLGCSNQNPPAPGAAAPMDNHDESIVPDLRRSFDPNVQNGDIYDKAVLKAADIKTLIVPENAKLERSGADGAIELYVKKTQSFAISA